jgi:hypothetical protein
MSDAQAMLAARLSDGKDASSAVEVTTLGGKSFEANYPKFEEVVERLIAGAGVVVVGIDSERFNGCEVGEGYRDIIGRLVDQVVSKENQEMPGEIHDRKLVLWAESDVAVAPDVAALEKDGVAVTRNFDTTVDVVADSLGTKLSDLRPPHTDASPDTNVESGGTVEFTGNLSTGNVGVDSDTSEAEDVERDGALEVLGYYRKRFKKAMEKYPDAEHGWTIRRGLKERLGIGMPSLDDFDQRRLEELAKQLFNEEGSREYSLYTDMISRGIITLFKNKPDVSNGSAFACLPQTKMSSRTRRRILDKIRAA